MDFTGRHLIPAPPETVWAGLTDPALLAAAIPGCEALDKTGENDFTGTVTIEVGAMQVSLKCKVTLSEMEPPHRLKLSGSGDGGVAGFVKGGAEIGLTPEKTGTVLTFTASARTDGELAQLDQGLIEDAAKHIAGQFFEHLAQAMTESLEPDPASAELGVVVMAPPAPVSIGTGPQQGRQSGIWTLGLVGVIAVLLMLFLLVL